MAGAEVHAGRWTAIPSQAFSACYVRSFQNLDWRSISSLKTPSGPKIKPIIRKCVPDERNRALSKVPSLFSLLCRVRPLEASQLGGGRRAEAWMVYHTLDCPDQVSESRPAFDAGQGLASTERLAPLCGSTLPRTATDGTRGFPLRYLVIFSLFGNHFHNLRRLEAY